MSNGNRSRLLFINLAALILIVLIIVFIMGLLIYREKLAGIEDELNSSEAEIDKCEDKFKSREAELNRRLESAEDKLTDISALTGNTGTSEDAVGDLPDSFLKMGLSLTSEGEKIIAKFDTVIYFETNETGLSAWDRENIDSFTAECLKTALSDEYIKYIDKIVVEGHADDGGGYLYNLDLSYKRAYSVVNRILDNSDIEDPVLDAFKKLIVISGCSYNFPMFTEGNIDRDKSRRVEIKLYLKKNREEEVAENELMEKLREIIERRE